MALSYPSYMAPTPGGGFLAGLANGQKIIGAAGDQVAAGQQEGRTNDTLSTLSNNLYAPPVAGTKPSGPSGVDLQKFGLPDQATLTGLLSNPETREVGLAAISNARSAYLKANDPGTKLDLEKTQLQIDQLQHPRGPGPTEQMRNFEFSQNNPGFQDFIDKKGAGTAPAAVQGYLFYRDQATQAGERPMSFLDYQGAMKGNGLQVQTNPDGTTTITQGGPTKPLTEGQSKDVYFFNNGSGALNDLGDGAALTDLGSTVGSNVPVAGNYLKSDQFRKEQQAGNSFLNAILRKESGAAIRDEEQKSYGTVFLPQPGDDAATLKQKASARVRALNGIKLGLPPQAILSMEKGGVDMNPGEQNSAPAPGAVEDGYRFKGGDPSSPDSWEPAQ